MIRVVVVMVVDDTVVVVNVCEVVVDEDFSHA